MSYNKNHGKTIDNMIKKDAKNLLAGEEEIEADGNLLVDKEELDNAFNIEDRDDDYENKPIESNCAIIT